MTNLTGHSLGRYHILEQLGEGGMATVYKAYDTRLERDVAVKVLRTEQFAPAVLARILKRFEREAKALSKLTHPNIVGVIDYGNHEGSPYLVMEYLPGGTLKQRLGKPIPWQEAARLLVPVARALNYSHQKGIIHRDVKPSNILITEDGEPMVTDFGIAKILDEEATVDLTGTSATVGTPEYMAPEQVISKSVDHRADNYSLGIVFYEMITGRKPYVADTPMAVLFKQASEPLLHPRQFAPGLPEAVEEILLKALSKKPEDRYQSMGEFASAIDNLRSGPVVKSPMEAKPARDDSQDTMAQAASSETHLQGVTQDETPRKAIPSVRLLQEEPQRLAIGVDRLDRKPWLPWMAGLGAVLLLSCLGIGLALLWDDLTDALFLGAVASPSPGIGSTWTRPADGMVMVYVPEGEFVMGSKTGNSDEKPTHTVYLDAFWMDQTEVTNEMYAKFLNEKANQSEGGKTWLGINDEDVLILHIGNIWKPESGYENHPVIEVNWYGAQAYCEWAKARLPTEAEWEKAARGGLEGMNYPWGNQIPVCTAQAEDGAQNSLCGGTTLPVGTFAPNGYGLFDMAGNVWEWVADWYSETYYSQSPLNNPGGSPSGLFRVIRGGSWNNYVLSIRSAYRGTKLPGHSNSHIGFRCVTTFP